MQAKKQARAPADAHGVLPPMAQQQLRLAAAVRDYAAIDAITDDLVRMGLCRRRSECAWMTRADIAQAVTKGRWPDCN